MLLFKKNSCISELAKSLNRYVRGCVILNLNVALKINVVFFKHRYLKGKHFRQTKPKKFGKTETFRRREFGSAPTPASFVTGETDNFRKTNRFGFGQFQLILLKYRYVIKHYSLSRQEV